MSVVLTDFADGVAVITLNRPEAKNAVNLELAEALAAAIDEFEERFDALTEGEDPTTLTGAQAEELKQMQAEEIAISLADLECEQDLDRAIREVEIELFGVPVSD